MRVSNQAKKKAARKINKDSECAVVRGEVDLGYYESVDGEWREIGLSAPARRALINAKLFKVSDLRKISLVELKDLHGMGKTGIARIEEIMAARKMKFRSK